MIIRLLSKLSFYYLNRWRRNPKRTQEKVFLKAIKKLEGTEFGEHYKISRNMTYLDWKEKVPILEYEDYQDFIQKILDGQNRVLWPGKLKYLCKSSGTTSGSKIIPLYDIAIIYYYVTSFLLVFNFIFQSKLYNLFKGKIFYLYGGSSIKNLAQYKFGFVGHITSSLIPDWLIRSKFPRKEISEIQDWNTRLDMIAKEMMNENLTAISGTPPWINMLFRKFKDKHHRSIGESFKSLSLYSYGGCGFSRYREEFFQHLEGKTIWTMETFPASEGYIAFQDRWDLKDKSKEMDLLLNIGSNIFFEFIEYENGILNKLKRFDAGEVEIGKNYAIVITTIGGFISYLIGDTFEITSISPLRVKFSGRCRQNINLVNEHMDYRTIDLIFQELKIKYSSILDFILIPKMIDGKACYFWVLETNSSLSNKEVSIFVDEISKLKNQFYDKWRESDLIALCRVIFCHQYTFLNYLNQKESAGQNKIPNVIQDDFEAVKILKYIESSIYANCSESFESYKYFQK